MKPSLGALLLACSLLGCAASPPPPAAEPAAEPALAAPPPVVVKKPPAELSRYWTFEREPAFTLYADLSALTQTELVRGLIPALLRDAGDALSAPERDCLLALVEHADQLVLGSVPQTLGVLTLGDAGVQAARAACVGRVLPAEPLALEGASEAYALGEQRVALTSGGVVLIGHAAAVTAALAPAAKPAPLPEHFTLSGEQQLTLRFELPERQVFAHGALSLSPQRFLLAGQVQLPSDAVADDVEKAVAARTAQAQQLAQGGGPQAALLRVTNALSLERKGRAFDVRFELPGTPSDQAQDLGVVLALGTHAVKRYMANAKLAEAKSTLGQITKSYQSALMVTASAKPGKAKLASLPPVPAEVPRGRRQATVATDWQAWTPIQFKLEEPQYFQYEVVAAKDGKSADVIARGDLNGDGKTSELRLKVTLDAKSGQLTAQGLDEKDPFE